MGLLRILRLVLNRPSFRLAGILFGCLLLAGCGTAQVYRTHMGVAADRSWSLLNSNVPSSITARVLDSQQIYSPFGMVRPGRAADALIAKGAVASDPDGLYALADLRCKQARKAEVFAPGTAPGLYLDAVEAATYYLNGLTPSQDPAEILAPREQEGQKVYNEASAGFLRSSAGSWMKLDQAWQTKLAGTGIQVEFRRDSTVWNPESFDHFYFTQDYRVLGIHDFKKTIGLGVPLIAQSRTPPNAMATETQGPDKYYPERLKAYPATAVLRVGHDPSGGRKVVVELIDTMRSTQIEFDGGPRPVANDLTTPLSFYFTSLPLPQVTQVGMLRPGELEKSAGLYLLHPFEKGKIPVVLIHGLWSSPDTWQQALNELRGDPELRDRFQFLVYFYPTGDPFLYSAAKLRDSLVDFRQTFDPDHTDSAFDQTVLVGHSMGGLLTRLMVINSEGTFWDSIANRPFSELQAGPGQREMVEKVFFFEANPSIRRVVFICTPHRGSSLSGELIGKVGNALIKLPGMFGEIRKLLHEQNDPNFFKKDVPGDAATSISQLSPQSTVLAALNQQPLMPRITSHSIIAKATAGSLATSTDRVVTYESSHLPEAVSEHVVDDNHGCLGNPSTIEEMRRILYLHLRELDRERKPGETRPPASP